MAKYINADRMLAEESEAYLNAQSKIEDKLTRDINYLVHTKLQRLLSDAPAENVVPLSKESSDKGDIRGKYAGRA